jgi:nucleotide-binding universal stress UspA family protein
MKTILVPIDISEEKASAAALRLGRDMAKMYGGKLVLLNVVEQVPGYVVAQLPEDFHRGALADARARLKAMAQEHGLDETADVVVREGHAPTEILAFAEDIEADMIVVASHTPGLVDYLLGSVAARVVRHAQCSVMVARNFEG